MIIDFKFNGHSFNNPTDSEHLQFQADTRRRIETALEIIKDKISDSTTGSVTIEYSNFVRYDKIHVNGFGMETVNVLMALEGF